MAKYLNVCRFRPVANGVGDWTYASTVVGYQSPALAGVVNGETYRYRAESADMTQWEMGTGTYDTGTGILTRTTVLTNSSGTGTSPGQTGAGTKINFTAIPQVAIVALKEDVPSLTAANAFTDTTEATGAGTTYAARFEGGVEFAKKVFIAGAVAITDTTEATGAGTTAAMLIAGGVEIAKKLFVVGVSTLMGNVAIGGTAASSSTTTGALIVAGGVGVAGALYSASLVTSAGVSAGGNMVVGFGVGAASASLTLNSGTGVSTGAYIVFSKASAITWYYGHSSALVGDALNDLLIVNASGYAQVARFATADGSLKLSSTTASSSTTTGALIVAGGVGVAGSIYSGGLLVSAGVYSTGAMKCSHPTAGLGYDTGAGGTVTQATNRTTGVTLNKSSGAITLFSQVNTAISQATAQSFTVTNSAVAATDTIIVSQKSGTDKYEIFVTNVAAGSFQITNYAVAGTTNEAPVFNFTVIKGVTS